MKVTRISILSGISRTLEVDITLEQLEQISAGRNVKWLCPNLPNEDKEFLISGNTAEDWEQYFKQDTKG